ncbi:MAG: bifunctional salicylyl-CoA 5-hydroxylase/oxidoreductase [Alphaproteobacteria bacterium]|nr:bifunctional salicylyl-CoA 5-hydroxylase/oxidoreductase [Alphaproteobacteria bacterium]
MKIGIVGGGPAGLYFGLLMKRSDPRHHVRIYERNRPDDTFGFGVVFSDETLAGFRDADAASFRDIVGGFAWWDEIEVRVKGARIRSGGHGFCGIARKELLAILQRHCREAGVELRFQAEVGADLREVADCDLVLAADGINSAIRERHQAQFRPRLDWRKNKFIWLGTTLPLDAFTFIFKQDPAGHGIWNVHAYKFNRELATFIVETTESCWRRNGLDRADEATSVALLENLFRDDLAGHRLIANKSIWRTFPTVRNATWRHGNIVLMGDAAHTAHFSIGSGTKLAMEDAIALYQACTKHPDSVARALEAYEAGRKDEVERLQTAAQTSLEWFEQVERYWNMEPEQLTLSMLSRSKRVTYDNLRLRDSGYGAAVDRWWRGHAAREGTPVPAEAPPMFTPFRLRGLTLENRVVVSPMCQYSAENGTVGDWHLVHLGGRAIGGAGLVMAEMTAIAADARITPGCAGVYAPGHIAAWKRVVDFVHASSRAKIGLQLGHAGRKGATCLPWAGGYDRPLPEGAWPILSASALPYRPDSRTPKAMDEADMARVAGEYAVAAGRALEAGFDLLEIHMAHGYLLASFISPLTNRRNDGYGGDVEGRMRFPLRVFDAVRAAWPKDRPISVRISATDWVEDGGLSEDDSLAVARLLKQHGCDLIDVSAGQTVAESKPVYGRMFQTPFSDRIRNQAGIATMAVGAITTADQVNTIVASGRADLAALARPHLADPYFTLHAAAQYGHKGAVWPRQYEAGGEQAQALAARERAELEELRRAARATSRPKTGE